MSTDPHIPDLIIKKRNGGELSREDIDVFINGVVAGQVQGSQIGAMLMAMYLKDLTVDETTDLTRAMMNSGDVLEWPEGWKGLKVDKHSTGGVGDKVSLILAPALAACGMKVPMISGRGLGHTGGTLDKLEAIPGFKVEVTSEEMLDILKTVGCCIVGQTKKLCPADKDLYATRDVTGTVDHIGLIAASIISKKAAENVDALILDVKFGKGAFLSDINDSRRLAERMVKSGQGLGIKTVALLTDMNSPLGHMIGNGLEVAEAITCLHGNGPADLNDLVIQLGGNLLSTVGKATSPSDGAEKVKATIQDGRALRTFCSMLKGQGVDPKTADDLCAPGTDMFSIIPTASHKEELFCRTSGFVTGIDAMTCAVVAQKLGAGRQKAGEAIDYAVGLQLLVSVGDPVKEGSPWIRVHRSGEMRPDLKSALEDAITIDDKEPVTSGNRIREVIS